MVCHRCTIRGYLTTSEHGQIELVPISQRERQTREMTVLAAPFQAASANVRRTRRLSLVTGAIVTLCVLIPCYWQPHIEANDLPSHLYNAWLYLQVHATRPPGIIITHPATNFLADELLALTMSWFGPWWSEHLVVSLSVLLFFWGAFRLVATLTNKQPWALIPLLAMLSYGLIFRWGFLNFYLSTALSLWAGCFALSHRPMHRLWAFPLFLSAVSAHAMPPLWMAAVVLYIYIFNALAPNWRIWIFVASVLATTVGRLALPHFVRCWFPGDEVRTVRFCLGIIGVGQVSPYGVEYSLVVFLVLIFLLTFLPSLRGWKFRRFPQDRILQLVLLSILVSVLSPSFVLLRTYPMPFMFLNERMSLFVALLGCVLVGRSNLHSLRAVTLALAGLLFFSFAYLDERAPNKVEERVSKSIAKIPPLQRVILFVNATYWSGLPYDRVPSRVDQWVRDAIESMPKLDRLVTMVSDVYGSGIPWQMHLIDRPCIGRCFDYANYEATTGQFRLRATGPNPYVLWNLGETSLVGAGKYVVQERDIPLYWIHLCNNSSSRFCVEPTAPGQVL